MEDLKFLAPLEFSVQIIALEDGVDVIFDTLKTVVLYEWRRHTVVLTKFERTYKTHIDPLDPDDICPIENGTIDLTRVIREEIIMATHL